MLKVNIHNKTAKAYGPKREEYYINDVRLEGFYIRVRTNGRMTYEVKSRLTTTGQLKEKTIGSSYLFTATEARKIATNFIKDCKKGIDP